MLVEDTADLQAELDRYEALIKEQMDRETQDQLEKIEAQNKTHDSDISRLSLAEKTGQARLEKEQTRQAEAEYECAWLQQR